MDKTPDSRFLAIDNCCLTGADFQTMNPHRAGQFMTELLNREAFHFMQMAFGYLLSSGIRGDYHEYGCFSARTIRMALSEARRYELETMYFFAFDSFEGLPEPSKPRVVQGWDKGAMAMSVEEFGRLIQAHGVYVEKVTAVKGFYDKTLTAEMQKGFVDSGRRIAIVNVDCDLYESAIPVLNFIEPLLQEGSLIYLDDYFCGYGGNPTKGVAGAFHEFEKRTPWRFQPFLNAGWWGKSFIAYR